MKTARTHTRFVLSYSFPIKTLTLCFLLLPFLSFGAVITVPGDYSTIQAAIDAASDD